MTEPLVRRCAVLGSPIAHSLSPVLHRAAYTHLGLPWEYTAHEVRETELPAFLAGLDASWRGLSLTMPLKRVALEVADVASDLARSVGAANTLILEPDGSTVADNTDVGGTAQAIRGQAVGELGSACVWGGGATAASVLTALATLGVADVHLHVRDAARAAPTIATAGKAGLDLDVRPWQITDGCADADVVASTVPAGAADQLADALVAPVTTGRLLFDVVYDLWPTPLAARWQQAGGRVASGLDMLVHQAVRQIRLMTGYDVPARVLFDALP